MKTKYAWIYGVQCANIKFESWDKYGVYIKYKVKYGHKFYRCWISMETARYLTSEGLAS